MNAVRSIIRALRVNTRAVERETGLSLAQYTALEELSIEGPMPLHQLARTTATHESSISVVVRRLLERGAVLRTRSPTDRRVFVVSITPAGRALLADVSSTVPRQLYDALRRLSPTERRELADGIERWLIEARIEPVVSRP